MHIDKRIQTVKDLVSTIGQLKSVRKRENLTPVAADLIDEVLAAADLVSRVFIRGDADK